MAKTSTIVLMGAAVAVPLAVLAFSRKAAAHPTEPEDEHVDPPGAKDLDPESPPDNDPGENDGGSVKPVSTVGKPIVVGPPSSPLVAPYLALLAKEFLEAGVDIELITPLALTVMSKAPKQQGERPVAIPPQNMWEGLAQIAAIDSQIAHQGLMDIPSRFTGYRPKDYNQAVGGAPKSRHIYGDAIDWWLTKPNAADRERLRTAVARYVVTHKNASYGFGFGVYTNDIHLDIGRKAGTVVTWEQGKKYIDKAKAELGIG